MYFRYDADQLATTGMNKKRGLVRIFRLAYEGTRPRWNALTFQRILGGCILLFGSMEARSELIYIDPHGVQTKLNGFSSGDVGVNITRTRVVSQDDSEYTYDSKNALSKPSRDKTARSPATSRLSMNQFNLAVSKQTRTAVGMEAKLTYRVRGDGFTLNQILDNPDVNYRTGSDFLKRDWYERLVGVYRPDLGSIHYGTQLSRSWSRSNDFSWRVGMSGVWADSGAGHGVFQEAIRIASRQFEDATGKVMFEYTYATNDRNTSEVEQSRTTANGTPFSPGATRPEVHEFFVQYSKPKNLVEFIVQMSSGALQTSFGKSAAKGWIGDPDTRPTDGNIARQSGKPSQGTVILQGSYWPDQRDQIVYGIRRNYWSGSAPSCNFNTTRNICIFGVDPGFNYSTASEDYKGYKVTNWDAFGGMIRKDGLLTYSVGGTYFGRAATDNPIEWGQGNTGLSLSFGVGRLLPEISNKLNAGFGISVGMYEHRSPAPTSMPGNSFLGPNSLYDRYSLSGGFGLTYAY